MPKPITQPTTAQSLGALLKSARDIMRKDKVLSCWSPIWWMPLKKTGGIDES
jgi:hypothetical protein